MRPQLECALAVVITTSMRQRLRELLNARTHHWPEAPAQYLLWNADQSNDNRRLRRRRRPLDIDDIPATNSCPTTRPGRTKGPTRSS